MKHLHFIDTGSHFLENQTEWFIVIIIVRGVKVNTTLGTRGFSRVRREFSVSAEDKHFFSRNRKPR